jgi:hypothetical protein
LLNKNSFFLLQKLIKKLKSDFTLEQLSFCLIKIAFFYFKNCLKSKNDFTLDLPNFCIKKMFVLLQKLIKKAQN